MSLLQAGSSETLSALLLEVQTTITEFSASGPYSHHSPVGEPSLPPPLHLGNSGSHPVIWGLPLRSPSLSAGSQPDT